VKPASNAFTFLEMLVVLFLIGIVTTIFLPRLTRRAPKVEWANVLDDLNNLVFFARQEAIANQRVHRIVFKAGQNVPDSAYIEQELDDPEKPGHKIYQSVSSYYFSTVYRFADAIKIKAVFSGKQNMFDEQRGLAFGYIIPDGLVQDISVQLTRKIEHIETGGTYRISPFLGKFEFFDGYVKPEA
jgi:prepilin-type N-terminal cleavage/methylation domain-containing protein